MNPKWAILVPWGGMLLIGAVFAVLRTPEGAPVREFFLTLDNFRFVAAQSVSLMAGTLGMCLFLVSGRLALLRATPWAVALGASWLGRKLGAALPGNWLANLTAPLPDWMFFAPAFWMLLLLSGGLALVLRQTVFGRRVRALGSNEAAARLSGLPIERLKTILYTVAALFFVLAGLLQTHPSHADSLPGLLWTLLECLAAAIFGGLTLCGGGGSVCSAIAGAWMLALLHNGTQQAGWPVPTQEIVTGGMLLGALALRTFRRRSDFVTDSAS